MNKEDTLLVWKYLSQMQIEKLFEENITDLKKDKVFMKMLANALPLLIKDKDAFTPKEIELYVINKYYSIKGD